MAFSHGSAAKIYLNGMNASNFINEVGLEGENDSHESTVLGDSAKTYIPGLQDASASMSGFWDSNIVDDTLSFSYKLESLHATETHATYMPAGDGSNAVAYLLKGILTSNGVTTSVDDLAAMELEFQNCTGLEKGRVLHPLSSVTATGPGTPVELDNTVLTSNGLSAVLHVNAVSGTSTPTITVKIQHSVDGNTYADLVTFAAATGKGSQYLSVSGTVNRYLQVIYTVSGTTPSFDIHVAAHRK